MLTRFVLHTPDYVYQLQDDDLRNWDDVRCSLKRSEFGGIVRSFTSQFEFVRTAYDLLLALYLKKGINAQASIEVLTQTDSWEWESRFKAPLDFSTISWENGVIILNSIDNSLAAIIKANKGVKYEFIVGEEIKPDNKLHFDRIPMIESATYEFTQGTSIDNLPDLIVPFQKKKRPWVGLIADEVCVNKAIHFLDDQEDTDNSYLLTAIKDVEITLDWLYSWRIDHSGRVNLYVRVIRGGAMLPIDEAGALLCQPNGRQYFSKGIFSSPSQLPNPQAIPEQQRIYTWATIDNIVWAIGYKYGGSDASSTYEWQNTGKSFDEYFTLTATGSQTLNLMQGDKVVIYSELDATLPSSSIRFVKSSMAFRWMSRGDMVDIDVLEPAKVCKKLLERMAQNYPYLLDVEITPSDTRIAKTFLMAAESIRGLKEAKLYTSFSDFCEWMSTVFGYVYIIEEPEELPYKEIREACQMFFSPWSYDEEATYIGSDPQNIVYVSGHGRFFYRVGDMLYPHWTNENDYNEGNHPRRDILFKLPSYGEGLYRFVEGNVNPQLTDLCESALGRMIQTVRFLHREKLFAAEDVKEFEDVRDVKYSVDSSVIYSSVNIGYAKQDYDSINGRDEFNFNSTYSTGCTISDRKLTMISPYRADSFGVEFAAQKRGEDTTDNSSDTSVFFILCDKNTDGSLYPDRSDAISNSISGLLFNAAFSPIACVEANETYIAMQSCPLKLTFASSEGNSDIVIGERKMSDDIVIDSQFASAGRVEFTTCDIDELEDVNCLLSFRHEGMSYTGFLMECDHRYAKNAAVTYKLIAKEVQP